MSATPTVRREGGRGQNSTIVVEWGTIRMRLSQAESRALLNALSKVTLMPPRRGSRA